jgi:acyl-CoA reductase-like NAD-dependent aldehyde dehydrogenase
VLDKRRDELTKYMVAETTPDAGWAGFNLTVMKDFLLDTAGRIPTIEGRIPTTQDPGTGALVLKEPFGVVLAIAPWNAPYILGTRSVAFPLAAGNTVVLKGSELSPRVMWAIASVLNEAGLPKGALNFITSGPGDAAAVTEALVAHPEVKKVNFTGSTAVGKIIGRLAGEHLKPVLLELGGKAPAIVWEDAELENAAAQCALGAFLNAGQICMSTERVIVHKSVAAAFGEKLAAATEKFFGSSGDAPVLIQQRGVDKARGLVLDAVKKGARCSGADVNAEEASKTRMRPIIVRGVREEMDIYRTESFGPTVSVFEVETEEEALRLANDTEYGLSSAVFTEDLRRGLRLAKGIETGAVHINSMSVHDEAALPHGGAKASGFGRFNAGNLEEWVRTKTVTYKY